MLQSKKSLKKLNMYTELLNFVVSFPKYVEVTSFSNELLKKYFPTRYEQLRFEFESFAHGITTVLYHDSQITSMIYNKVKNGKQK